ncbi:MAG: GNAT family protein [Legionellales bacterium]|nr:GNAT family protein [Legionellales bacterium]
MTEQFTPVTLQGTYCTLVPLSYEHLTDLCEAAQDGKLSQLWYTFVPEPSKMAENISLRLKMQEEGTMLPFTVIDNHSDKAVGMTTYLNIDKPNCRVEIGGTWYRQSMQRTGLNTECKHLLLTHAFERWHCHAVEFRTHAFNHQSRRAIERLGAKLDGVLRNHMVMPNGTLRDTYVYSILESEWPTVKAHLEYLSDTTR